MVDATEEDGPAVTREQQLDGIVQKVWADAALYHEDEQKLLTGWLTQSGIEVGPEEFEALLARARRGGGVPVTDSHIGPSTPGRVERTLGAVRDVGTAGIHVDDSPGSHHLAPSTMAALRAHHRGGPEQLLFEDAPVPEPASDEVLIEVFAASITFTELDWDETWEREGVDRTPTIPSHEFSGVIAAVGDDVTGFARGDEVYGLVPFEHDGAAAEYLVLPAAIVAKAPARLSHVETAALPLAALTAWQALVDHGDVQVGQTVLVQGGAGGVGVFVIQLAKHLGAGVTTTVRGADVAFVESLGADRVIDFETDAFDADGRKYDIVIASFGGDTQERSYAVVKPGGHLITLSVPPSQERAAELGITATFFIVEPDAAELDTLAELADAGTLVAPVQATFPLADGRAAFETRTVQGKKPGKTVLVVRE
jgi:NADPH:quinone reductase-like Zn-dependent oxidoreductase